METSSTQEWPVTLASLTPILKLDKLQVKAYAPGYAADAPLPRVDMLRLLLADLLERLAFLTPSQRQAIMACYNRAGSRWETLAFADANWCTWTSHNGWFDLTTGDNLAELPTAPVETIGYNMVVLFDRAIVQIRKRAEHGKEHPAGSVDQP
jgi:hypothetical protein